MFKVNDSCTMSHDDVRHSGAECNAVSVPAGRVGNELSLFSQDGFILTKTSTSANTNRLSCYPSRRTGRNVTNLIFPT